VLFRSNESGATFNAEVISGDLSQIKEYGFVWSLHTNPALFNSDATTINGDIENGSFQVQVFNSLIKDRIYFVRSFAVTDKYIIYGPAQSFKSLGCKAPTITDFYPRQGGTLDTITINGDNYSSFPDNNTVFLDDLKVKVIESARTKLRFLIPPTNRKGEVKIRIVVALVETESSEFLILEGE